MRPYGVILPLLPSVKIGARHPAQRCATGFSCSRVIRPAPAVSPAGVVITALVASSAGVVIPAPGAALFGVVFPAPGASPAGSSANANGTAVHTAITSHPTTNKKARRLFLHTFIVDVLPVPIINAPRTESEAKKKRPSGPLMNQKDVIVLENLSTIPEERGRHCPTSSLWYRRCTYSMLTIQMSR